MEVILAVIRPKVNVTGQDYKSKFYDILLLDHKTPDRHGKSSKVLPSFGITLDREPRDVILSHVYSLTGGEHGGIKGERVLLVPWKNDSQRASLDRFTLYCVPVSPRDKLNSSFVEKSPLMPGFYSLDTLIHSLNLQTANFPPPTKTFVMHIETWLREKHSKPGALDLAFRSRAEFRVKYSVNNPAFLPVSMGLSDSGPPASIQSIYRGMTDFPDEIRVTANNYAAKLMEIEKCDKVVINPLFGTGLIARHRSKPIVPCPAPDYYIDSGTTSRKSSLNSSMDPGTYTSEERELYAVQIYAAKGDVAKVQDCISRGYPLSKHDPYGMTPVHYAAWFGFSDVVQVLLQAGCSPNVVNLDDHTPLHLSAMKGFPSVVSILLSHPELDINLMDKKGRTALELCENKLNWEHMQVARLLETAARQPRQIQVYLEDGSSKMLNLIDGANTSVHQLNQQMLREFNMPETPYADIFTIWICSPSLELQLKPEHKPLEHMRSWNHRIVGNFTDGDSENEKPLFKWKRNAKISLIVEKAVEHPEAMRLLFHEAKQNYINAFYPCKDQDVILFASILLYLNHGGTDQQAAKAYLSHSKNLQQLIPAPNLKARSNWPNRPNWPNLILQKYRELCSRESVVRPQLLQVEFLKNCRNLTVYGSVFFTGELRTGKQGKCFIAVNDVGIHIINYQSRVLLHSYKYSEISWVLPNEYGVLELTIVRNDSRLNRHTPQNLKLYTKQAGMIHELMKKLSRIAYGMM